MPRKPKQSSFQGQDFKPQYEFGGALNKNSNPKIARSIITKHAMHVVLRSKMARGPFSLLKKADEIRFLLDRQANLFGIKVYEKAVVGNHIHLLIYLKTNSRVQGRRSLSCFLRAVSGLIARLILGKERGRMKKGLAAQTTQPRPARFWVYRPYTRVVVGFKRGYQVAKDYVVQNHLEAIGVIPYQPRKLRQSSA